ncbi:head protein [Archangium violaceum]|uniref:head protein n=1 Tax=Archangium violaceum TaxID=83451 RepID=UPI002B2F9664|nr:head protein [Archangium violaceum]
MAIGDFINNAVDFLGRIHENTQSAEEKEWLVAAADALEFIWATGRAYEFEDYRKSRELDAPALVVAAFKTREEAEAWLANNPSPPAMAYVLITDEYHLVAYRRESNWRAFLPHPTLELYLEEMMRDGLPPAVATFGTREEADAWFHGQTESRAQSVIQVGGEYFLAVYYRNINHRALFPFSIAERHKKRKKRPEE